MPTSPSRGVQPPTATRKRPLALFLALALSCLALGVYGLTRPSASESRCRIEVYADGSAEPICQPGYMPTRPVAEWPIVRVEV